jgi:hypothetical protein
VNVDVRLACAFHQLVNLETLSQPPNGLERDADNERAVYGPSFSAAPGTPNGRRR